MSGAVEEVESTCGSSVGNLRCALPKGHKGAHNTLDDPDLDDPYCQCGNEPIEDEQASGICFGCGKPL